MGKAFIVKEYLRYFLFAKYWRGHGVHSPAAYEFIRQVLYKKLKANTFTSIEKQIKQLKRNTQKVTIDEIGSKSIALPSNYRRICDIAKKTGVRKKYGRLLFRIANHYSPETIVELGTGAGISALYLANAVDNATMYSLEYNPVLIKIAEENIKATKPCAVNFIAGDIKDSLPELISKNNSNCLFFIDGNHNYKATLEYFWLIVKNCSNSIVVFDDIYWSPDMKKAWKEITRQTDLSIDIFQFGVVILKEKLTPGNYRVRF